MLKNYLVMAFRHWQQGKVYAAINVIGLAVGLACFGLVGLYVQDELTYDRFHVQADHIYRVVYEKAGPYPRQAVTCPEGLGTVIGQAFPEVRAVASLGKVGSKGYMSYKDITLPVDDFFYVSPTFFDVFSFPLVQGDSKTALTSSSALVITESVAARLFPADDPMGKVIMFGQASDPTYRTVTGVAADPPLNAHFKFSYLSLKPGFNPQLSPAIFSASSEVVWGSFVEKVYLLLDESVDPADLEARFPAFLASQNEPRTAHVTLRLQPLTDIHLTSHYEDEFEPNGYIAYIYLFSVLALLILLIAMINFINLASVRFAPRAREIGVRKVFGAARKQLVTQLLGESLLVSLAALVLALTIIQLMLPVLNAYTGKAMQMAYFGWMSVPVLVLAAVVSGLLAGSYSALFLTHFHPVAVLKGVIRSGRGDALLRKWLMGFQFVAAISLAAGAVIVLNQLRHLQTQQFGFDKEQVLVISKWTDIGQYYEVFKAELLRDPGVVSVTTGDKPGQGANIKSMIPDASGTPLTVDLYSAGYDYFETLGLTLITGRAFSPDHPSDPGKGLILSESAVHVLGLKPPVIGQTVGGQIYQANHGKQIIGVVNDFNIQSVYDPVVPAMIAFSNGDGKHVLIKIRSEQVGETIKRIETIYNTIHADHPMMYAFLEEEIDALYRYDQRFGSLFGMFSMVAILIAVMGLVGLAAFTTEQRNREVGLRKVLGASVTALVVLLIIDFLKIIAMATALALPVSYVFAQRWIEDFAYQAPVGPVLFGVIILSALGLVLIAVGAQVIRAARRNPVDALRAD